MTAVQAMQNATEDLKSKKDKIGVEQVEKLRDEMEDLAADMAEIQGALANPMSGSADEEAEAELAALYAQQEDKEEEEAMRILMGGGASSTTAYPAVPAANPAAKAGARPMAA